MVLLEGKEFHGLHDDLKIITKTRGRYPVQKFWQPKKRDLYSWIDDKSHFKNYYDAVFYRRVQTGYALVRPFLYFDHFHIFDLFSTRRLNILFI